MTARDSAANALLRRFGYVQLKPRSSSPLGLFGSYDGNVIGGALLGVGISLTGALPGTLLVQCAVGMRSGAFALAGSVLGGLVWSGLLRERIKDRNKLYDVKPKDSTLEELLGVSKQVALSLFEAACVATVSTSAASSVQASWAVFPGVIGGLMVGASQIFSLLTRKTMIGISGAYEEAGNYLAWALRGLHRDSRPSASNNLRFGCGVFTGALVLSKLAPELVGVPVGDISPISCFIGGILITVGSRTAGGCTSGHGISGLALLSTSSAVTIASTFASSVIAAHLA